MMKSQVPVGDMINEMLFKHETPSLDDIEQGLFERFPINFEPVVKHFDWVDVFTFLIDLLIGVNLQIYITQNIIRQLITRAPLSEHQRFIWGFSQSKRGIIE